MKQSKIVKQQQEAFHTLQKEQFERLILVFPNPSVIQADLLDSITVEAFELGLELSIEQGRERDMQYRQTKAQEKIANKVGGLYFGAVSTKLSFPDGREIEIPSAPLVPSREEFDAEIARLDRDNKCTNALVASAVVQLGMIVKRIAPDANYSSFDKRLDAILKE